MSAFDRVIGYENIKEKLLQVCDMVHEPEAYRRFGAKLPHGILLEGEPGLGKTLLAKCFIEESGLEAYILRRTRSDGDFPDLIAETFEKAKENAPSVVLLDDLDKFADEDCMCGAAEEYTAVQAGIDESADSGVIVIATVNNAGRLPDSLTRAGRFDRRITVLRPDGETARHIIRYYLSGKKVSENMNMDDVCGMIPYHTCAELETMMNEAAVFAAYRRSESIETEDIVQAVLENEYDSAVNSGFLSEGEKRNAAVHEAGHAVICELLCPGSVGIVSVRGGSHEKGFVRLRKELPDPHGTILAELAGKAATELFFPGTTDDGAGIDLNRACRLLERELRTGSRGFGMFDVQSALHNDPSEEYRRKSEDLIRAELEKSLREAQRLLAQNLAFLRKLADALMEKETLLVSDVKAIRESANRKNNGGAA